jgi:hypothetical protein
LDSHFPATVRALSSGFWFRDQFHSSPIFCTLFILVGASRGPHLVCCRRSQVWASFLTSRSSPPRSCFCQSNLVIIFARVACGLLQGGSRSCLELLDQKARGFLVFLALKWMFPEHVHRLLIRFLLPVSHVFLPTLICVSTAVPNLVPRCDSFSIAIRSWPS